MAYVKSSFILLLLISLPLLAATSKMARFITKQENNNVRYLTIDGKFTYYQAFSGTLYLSANYLANEFLKSSKGTHYEIIGSNTRKRIIITQDSTMHNEHNLKKLKTIYIAELGSLKSKEIGLGINPKLHLNDTWISYYNPYTYSISFYDIENGVSTLDLSLAAKTAPAPYFVPEVVMFKNRSVLYSDINNKGIVGLIYYDRITKETKSIYKAPTPSSTVELCLNDKSLFISNIDRGGKRTKSEILLVDPLTLDLAKSRTIYTSKFDDVGQMDCSLSSTEIYFIQNQKDQNGKDRYELVEFNWSKNQTTTLSDLGFVTSYFNLDGRLLIPHQGELFLAKGPNTETSDNFVSPGSN